MGTDYTDCDTPPNPPGPPDPPWPPVPPGPPPPPPGWCESKYRPGTDPLTQGADTLPDGTVGVAYSGLITASGGEPPYVFGVVAGSLPPGLSLSSAGALTGTPTDAGIYPFTVRVVDAYGCYHDADYSVEIADPLFDWYCVTAENYPLGPDCSGFPALVEPAHLMVVHDAAPPGCTYWPVADVLLVSCISGTISGGKWKVVVNSGPYYSEAEMLAECPCA